MFQTFSELPDIGLPYHTSAFQWLLISGIFMGANVPECICPGLFDLFGYGHQIFHICIFMVCYNLCHAARNDAVQYGNAFQPELYSPMMKVLVANALGIGTTLWVLMEYAKVKTRPQKVDKTGKVPKLPPGDTGHVPENMATAN